MTYSVTIDTATFSETTPYPFAVNGSVSTTNPSQPATSVTVIITIPDEDPITVVSNLPTSLPGLPTLPSTFGYFGPLPDGRQTLPEGSAVTVYSTGQSQASKTIDIVS